MVTVILLPRSNKSEVLFSLSLTLVTFLAFVALSYATYYSFSPSGLHPTSWTKADLIRNRCPIRLIQPEWVSAQPDTITNWLEAEHAARFLLIALLWWGGITIIISRYLRKKDS